ncbi:hypothetical protein CDAR_494511 [Caerostris darwini]|uniref:Gustatory receptor n=1 Tax=Caerostris darwini TaxID=1538125 RepID=A0AAV4SCS2_9ARAC|nr:hypothetical protein CDAR_494511 [Caerostris darwini]
MILVKDVEGETLEKIAAVHFGNAVTQWMSDAGVLKAMFLINYFCSCFFTNALMNLFTGLSCYFFHNFREAISGCTESLCQGTENIEKTYQIYMHVLMLADAVENEFGHLFFLVTADGCLQAFTGISYFMGLETGWTTPPHSHVFILYSITYIFNWTFFIVIAGEVHEQDAVFKKCIALNLLKCPENFKKRQLNLLNSLKLKIAISAWGYFDFNRSLLMVAIGAVLTYSILVTQL